jgi:hypothetical protein
LKEEDDACLVEELGRLAVPDEARLPAWPLVEGRAPVFAGVGLVPAFPVDGRAPTLPEEGVLPDIPVDAVGRLAWVEEPPQPRASRDAALGAPEARMRL